MTAYIAAAVTLNLVRHRSVHPDGKELISQGFDAATFAASALVLWGVIEPPMLKLIGSTKPFLIIGGVAGVLYSVGVLFPRK